MLSRDPIPVRNSKVSVRRRLQSVISSKDPQKDLQVAKVIILPGSTMRLLPARKPRREVGLETYQSLTVTGGGSVGESDKST